MSSHDEKMVSEIHKKYHGVDGIVGSMSLVYVHWRGYPAVWKGQF